MIKSAIFDIDGTLLDSSPMWEALGEHFLLANGVKPHRGLSDRLLRLSLKEGAALLSRDYTVDMSAEEILAGLKRIISDFYCFEAPPKRGAAELLRALSERGISMSLATAGDERLSRAALTRLDMIKYFKGLASCEKYGGKSSPEIFIAAAQMAGGTAEETIVFEDSLHAAETAKRAGFAVAAVRDIGEPEQSKLCYTADYYMDSLAEYAEKIDDIIR